jgi:hypothetical protein
MIYIVGDGDGNLPSENMGFWHYLDVFSFLLEAWEKD